MFYSNNGVNEYHGIVDMWNMNRKSKDYIYLKMVRGENKIFE